MTWTHQVITGASQAGKTKFAEHAFRTTPLMSVFVDSKGDAERGKLGGARVVRCSGRDVQYYALNHGKVIWAIPKLNRRVQFEAFMAKSQRLAAKVGRPHADEFIDEIQQFSASATTVRGEKYSEAVLEQAASEILGLGVRIRGISQRIVGFHPLFRENARSNVVFQMTHEGMQGVGWPFKEWQNHLAQPYNFVHYDGMNYQFHTPVPRL